MKKDIILTWDGPYDYAQIIVGDYRDEAYHSDFGLYQIYGPHPIYTSKKRPNSDNVLLYIGQTTSSSEFAGRIGSQGFCKSKEYEIFIAQMLDETYVEDENKWENDALDAEKILINKHAPSYNGQLVGDIKLENHRGDL